MDFGQALAALLSGQSITRKGWNRQNMQLGLQPPTGKLTQPIIYIQTANGDCGVWCPNLMDMLSNDWGTVENRGAVQGQGEQLHQHERVPA